MPRDSLLHDQLIRKSTKACLAPFAFGDEPRHHRQGREPDEAAAERQRQGDRGLGEDGGGRGPEPRVHRGQEARSEALARQREQVGTPGLVKVARGLGKAQHDGEHRDPCDRHRPETRRAEQRRGRGRQQVDPAPHHVVDRQRDDLPTRGNALEGGHGPANTKRHDASLDLSLASLATVDSAATCHGEVERTTSVRH